MKKFICSISALVLSATLASCKEKKVMEQEKKDITKAEKVVKKEKPKRIVYKLDTDKFGGVYVMNDAIALEPAMGIKYDPAFYCMVINKEMNKADIHLINHKETYTIPIVKVGDNRYELKCKEKSRFFSIKKEIFPANNKNEEDEEYLYLFFEDSSPIEKDSEPNGKYEYYQNIEKCMEQAEDQNNQQYKE